MTGAKVVSSGELLTSRGYRPVDKLEHMFYDNCVASVFVGNPCRFFLDLKI